MGRCHRCSPVARSERRRTRAMDRSGGMRDLPLYRLAGGRKQVSVKRTEGLRTRKRERKRERKRGKSGKNATANANGHVLTVMSGPKGVQTLMSKVRSKACRCAIRAPKEER